VRGQVTSGRGDRNDEDEAGGTLVESIGRYDHDGTNSCSFPTNRLTEVDKPDLSPARRH
jgi:hypothetical protein